jgi:hypothetical protein
MATMESGHAVAPRSSPANSATGRGFPVWIYSLLWFLCAAILIGIGDHLLRRQENLTVTIGDSSQVIPFSDYLQEQVRKKTEWNGLLAARDKALAAGNAKSLAAATYAISDFAATIDSLDAARRGYLLDLVARYGDSPEAINAYFLLFDPRWSGKMRSRYAAFTQKLLAVSTKEPDGGAATQLNLAQALRQDNETSLEIQVLKNIQATQPLSLTLAPFMKRLLDLEAPSDPNREKLTQELAAIDAWHDRMLQEAKQYQAFEQARVVGNWDEMIRLRAAMPATETDSFAASADAHLIDLDLRNGQFADARSLRETLTHYNPKDLEECSAIAMELTPPMEEIKPQKSIKAIPVAALPDIASIQLNRWRGFLDLGDQVAARAVADTLFVGNDKKLPKAAADLAAVARGDLRKLSPIATFKSTTVGIPPELKGATDVSFATIDLKPVGKGIPAGIHARMEMWISKDLILQIVSADEPRAPRPKTKVTVHDEDPWQSEYFEFFLNPDCWFNFYYHWAVTSAGVTWDARSNLVSEPSRLQYTPDKTVELGMKSTAYQTPVGWTVRILIPRKLLIPPGRAVVRFNVRRNRHVRERNSDVSQFYTWAPNSGTDHQPDRFGWLAVPQ